MIHHLRRLLATGVSVAVLAYFVETRRLRKRLKRSGPRGASLLEGTSRRITIVTTASLPWRTGTAVNATLRAAYLARDTKHQVVLLLPFVPPEDQARLFPDGKVFSSRAEQAQHVLDWAAARLGEAPRFAVRFYAARYAQFMGSIFPVEDVAALVPSELCDVAILEEPEHLNWFNFRTRWTSRYSHVVGVMHTNYLAYVAGVGQLAAPLNTAALAAVTDVVCRVHCHKEIKLSDAVQKLARSVTCNVHGVAAAFLQVGQRMRRPAEEGGVQFTKGAYFIGKAVWGKGYTELLEVLQAQLASAAATTATSASAAPAPRAARHSPGAYAPEPATLPSTTTSATAAGSTAPRTLGVYPPVPNGAFHRGAAGGAAAAGAATAAGAYPQLPEAPARVHVDVVGAGEDLDAIRAASQERGLDLRFLGGRDHAAEEMWGYRVLLNPSRSDVVATTTAEALAMGKWVVVEDIACNTFFKQFRNCLVYDTLARACEQLSHALSHDPAPLDEHETRLLSWEGATERLLREGSIAADEWPSPKEAAHDTLLWRLYRSLSGMKVLSKALGVTAPFGGQQAPQEEDDEQFAELAEQLQAQY